MNEQHTLKIRLNGRIVDVNCPPFTPLTQLESWLIQFRAQNPEAVIISKSWTTPDAAA